MSDPHYPPLSVTSRNRLLSDRILIAFNQAYEQDDLDVAERLVRVFETLSRRALKPNTNRRREMDNLVAAYQRLWLLRRRNAGTSELLRVPVNCERQVQWS
jgi:hypothetical protein